MQRWLTSSSSAARTTSAPVALARGKQLFSEYSVTSEITRKPEFLNFNLLQVVRQLCYGKPAPEHRVYPYLLRGMTAQRPNHVRGIEEVYLNDYGSPRDAWSELGHYVTFYNQERCIKCSASELQ